MFCLKVRKSQSIQGFSAFSFSVELGSGNLLPKLARYQLRHTSMCKNIKLLRFQSKIATAWSQTKHLRTHLDFGSLYSLVLIHRPTRVAYSLCVARYTRSFVSLLWLHRSLQNHPWFCVVTNPKSRATISPTAKYLRTHPEV